MVFAEAAPPDIFFDAIGIVFRYGFELGRRYEKRHGAQAGKKHDETGNRGKLKNRKGYSD